MSEWNRDHQNSDHSGISWLWVIIAFSVVPPLGLFLLVLKLKEMSENPSRRQQEWQRKSREWFEEAERGITQSLKNVADERSKKGDTEKKVQEPKKKAEKRNADFADWKPIRGGKIAFVVGIVIAALFGMGAVNEVLFWLPEYPWDALEDAFPLLMLACGGLGLTAWGHFKNKQAQRFRKLRNLIGNQKLVDIHAIAESFPCSFEKACDMLQNMAYKGYLGKKAYVDSAAGQLVLTGEGVRARRQQEKKEPEKTTVKQAEEELSILREIREVNDAIPDPELSRKIYRIEEITGHILEYQKKHPEKTSELHTFLNYYLPTTLKILNSYAELDRQGVDGENIAATKERIEKMMDMVVEGFETQLDKLFRDEMMDIASDISVMEKMMGRDGLTDHDMVMPKATDKGQTAADGIRLTLNPEEEQKGEAAVQEAPAAEASWESGFYRKTKDELDKTMDNQ